MKLGDKSLNWRLTLMIVAETPLRDRLRCSYQAIRPGYETPRRFSCNRSEAGVWQMLVTVRRSESCVASSESLWLGTPQTPLNLIVFRVAAASPPQTARSETPRPLPPVYVGGLGQSPGGNDAQTIVVPGESFGYTFRSEYRLCES